MTPQTHKRPVNLQAAFLIPDPNLLIQIPP